MLKKKKIGKEKKRNHSLFSKIHGLLILETGGGGYFWNFWVGMCRWDPGTLRVVQYRHPHRNGPYKPCVDPYESNGSTTGVYVL